MAQAIIDPVELRRFAHHLKQFNGDLRDRLGALHGQMVSLGDTWRDQEHEKFVRSFEETINVLGAFIESAEEQIPILLRKAERIEEYFRK